MSKGPDAGLIPMMYPDYRLVEDPSAQKAYEKFWGTKLNPQPGLTVVEIVHAILADEIRSMYIMGENPAMSDPDTHHSRKALAKLEHLVVQDIFFTETAAFADVILPASAWLEKTALSLIPTGVFKSAEKRCKPRGMPTRRDNSRDRLSAWLKLVIFRTRGYPCRNAENACLQWNIFHGTV